MIAGIDPQVLDQSTCDFFNEYEGKRIVATGVFTAQAEQGYSRLTQTVERGLTSLDLDRSPEKVRKDVSDYPEVVEQAGQLVEGYLEQQEAIQFVNQHKPLAELNSAIWAQRNQLARPAYLRRVIGGALLTGAAFFGVAEVAGSIDERSSSRPLAQSEYTAFNLIGGGFGLVIGGLSGAMHSSSRRNRDSQKQAQRLVAKSTSGF